MNSQLIARHNAVVKKEDTVWHLGDFALNEKLVPRILPLLNGKHYLVSGNHDRTHACHKRHTAAIRRYLGYGFLEVHQETRLDQFLLNHLPYVGDSAHEARYPEWRPNPNDEGIWLLHGHIHELWKIKVGMINVGVDVWDFQPVALEHLQALVKERT
jgi:calcineurin-like phosphoesterase family protein